MAKITFSKLALTKNTEVATFTWKDQIVEVKQYLPIQEKLDLIASVLNQCQDDNNFINEGKMTLFMNLEVVFRYTNITFTEKQKEDPAKLYDLLAGSGFFDDVFTVLPQSEYKCIIMWLSKTADHIYDYRNSVYGILDALSTDYSNLELDAQKIVDNINNPNTMQVLKGVLTQLD